MLRFSFIILQIVFLGSSSFGQDKYAILVGVESYSKFEQLDYAEDDAIALGQSLKALGYKVTVMTGQQRNSEFKPSNPEKILKVLQTQIESCVNGDTLVVSLSGHGIQFFDEAQLPSGIKETYFCPEDANKEAKSTLIPINQKIINMINGSAATKKLLLVDACRNEVLSAEAKKKGGAKLELDPVHESRRSVPGGMSVIFSCKSKQFSWEHDALGHSVFSNYVIEYLKGNANSRFYEEDSIDLDGLVAYVRKRTNDYVFSNNLSADGQYPVLRGDSSNWIMGKIIQKFTTNSIGMRLQFINAGSFTMGSPVGEKDRRDNELQHEVEIKNGFFIGTTEVTQRQWEKVMHTTPWKGEDKVKESENYPASYISWEDAVAFCKKLSQDEGNTYRLPSEAEWEYACRGGTQTAYSFGDSAAKLDEHAWFDKNAWETDEKFPRAVGQLSKNPFGLFDMHGNVFEWCEDELESERVLRGGAWYYGASDCRSAYREKLGHKERDFAVGFRVVRVD